MEGIGLKLTPVIGRPLLGHLSMFGPMTGTSWTQLVQTVLMESLTHFQLPTLPLHPL